jgi:hypothetical protein
VVYLLTRGPGCVEAATSIAKAAAAILRAGGIGVKVEKAGKAFSSAQWTENVRKLELWNLYTLFVLDSISDGESTYSCGMHNLGLPDAIVSGEEFQYSVDLLSMFGRYQLVDKPTIKDDETFSISTEDPGFRLTTETNQPDAGYDLLENPFGMWRLNRVDRDQPKTTKNRLH